MVLILILVPLILYPGTNSDRNFGVLRHRHKLYNTEGRPIFPIIDPIGFILAVAAVIGQFYRFYSVKDVTACTLFF